MGVEQLSAHVAAQAGAALRRTAGPTAADRIALDVRALLPVVEAQRAGTGGAALAASQLARELTTPARGQQTVTLILPPGGGPARIDTGMRQLAIPAALRDALLAALHRLAVTTAGSATGTAASATQAAQASAQAALQGAASASAWAIGAQAHAAAALASGVTEGLRRATTARDPERTVPSARFRAPLLDAVGPPSAVAAAARLQDSVERSGLFFESHLARWVAGERSTGAIQQELLALRPPLADGEPLRPAAPVSGERVAAQLEALQRQAFVLQGPAWDGQPVTIEIGRETNGGAYDDADDAVFGATMHFDLPEVGALTVRLRLAGDTIAATVEGRVDRVEPALPALADAFAARGLKPALVQAIDAPPSDGAGADDGSNGWTAR